MDSRPAEEIRGFARAAQHAPAPHSEAAQAEHCIRPATRAADKLVAPIKLREFSPAEISFYLHQVRRPLAYLGCDWLSKNIEKSAP